MKYTDIILFACSLLWCGTIPGIQGVDIDEVIITTISPRYGSVNGAVRLTITGSGFSADQFNFGEGRSNLGNKVKLVSETQTYDCEIYRDGTTQHQVQCHTIRMPADAYRVRVSVDGQPVPENQHCGSPEAWACTYNAHDGWSPYVTTITPRASLPGSVIQIDGKIFSTRYGSNKDESTNGKTQKILRAYVGGQLCEFRKNADSVDAEDELYGIELQKDGTSDWGYMKCKMKGTYVGNHNVSFILEAPYGRSNPAGTAYRVTAEDKITMFQTYAEIYNVTPSTGSIYGGTRLTVTGRYFDQTDAPARIDIAGTSCKVQQLVDDTIVCLTEPKPSSFPSYYPGNRGVRWDFWNSSYGDAFETWINMSDPDVTQHLDDMNWVEDFNMKRYIFKLTSFFIPPRDGDYRFYLTSDDDSQLYFGLDGDMNDLTKIAYAPNYAPTVGKFPSQISQKFTLQGKKPYPLVHIVKEHAGGAFANIAVLASQTKLTGARAATNVKAEIQTVYMTSDVLNEIQSISLENWNRQAKVEEVQRITVTSPNLGDTTFRIGYGGVYTGPLTGASLASDVQNALNLLPSISPDRVSVSKNDISGATNYDVTFKSELGDFEPLDTLLLGGNNSTVEVTEFKQGRASMAQFALKFANATTAPIDANAKASKIQEILNDFFSVRCPSILSSPMTRVAFKQDFETVTKYYETGSRVSDDEPFCGYTSLKNPTWLIYEHRNYQTPSVNLLITGQLCLAYKGKFKQHIYVDYYYKLSTDSTEKLKGMNIPVTMPVATDWNYVCVDIKSKLLARYPTLTETRLRRLKVYKEAVGVVYIDSILIAGDPPSANDLKGLASHQRLRPPMWINDGITVEGSADQTFTVNITLKNCAHNLPHFTVLGAEVNDTEEDEVTYNSDTWTSDAVIKVNKTQAASPPITNTFDLQFGNNTLNGISAGISESELKMLLETVPGVGIVSVVHSGGCADQKWRITWKSAPGDQPPLIMTGDRLTGTNVTSGVVNNQDGGIMFDPIPGDLLRRIHDKPQVIVDINKIPSVCSGSCDFEWDDAASPTLTGINPSTGSNRANTVLTLTGTGFSSTANENQVVIGGEPCDVTSATTTQILCNVGRGPAGEHDVLVTVSEKGLAGHMGGDKRFTYQFNIDGLDPNDGSLGGGTSLTITGTGFGENVTATVGGNDCEVKSYNYSAVVCITPAGSSGSKAVVVTEDSRTATSSTQFTYKTSLTPVITSIDTSTVSVEGGENITIAGTGFGAESNDNFVKIGNKAATIVSYSDTEIIVTTASSAPGSYPLKVSVGIKGYADTSTNSISRINYALTLTNVFPTSGSMEGGTTLTLTGTGFPSDKSKITVKVGDKNCDVISGTTTVVTCKTPTAGALVKVNNDGVHPDLGEHYAWDPATPTLRVGDTIQWSWTAPEFTKVKYMIQQTESATSNEAQTGGFHSGPQTAKGRYQYQFTNAGTYYYWSGYVDPQEKESLHGTIKVEANEARSEKIRLLVSGYDAIYNTGSGVSDPSDSSSCPGITSKISGCSESNPTAASSDFNFNYLKCKTPTVTSMSPNNGTSTDTITITGTGFSTTKCKNEVKFGTRDCTVSSASTTEIQCSFDAGNDTKVGIMMPLSVTVNNRGFVLNTEASDIDRHFILRPHIDGINPTEGSVKGATPVTIQGRGFYGSVSVKMGLFDCTVKSVDYDEIVCETTTGRAGTETVEVQVTEGGQPIPAVCETSSCEFTYNASLTPTVTAVSPEEITEDGTELSINGTQFGSDTNKVRIYLGEIACPILALEDEKIKCNVSNPVVGSNAVRVFIDGKGLADSASIIKVEAIISSVYPNIGSVSGGTLVKVDGLGFKSGSTSIKFGSQDCLDVRVSSSSIECKTPKGVSAGNVKVQVLSNSVTYPKADYAYDLSATPTITSVSPDSGKSGDSIQIQGTGFSSTTSEMNVKIDGVDCSVTAATSTAVTCNLGAHSAGEFPIAVMHASKGEASGTVNFRYRLTLTAISPNEGSFGGGQLVTLTGVGFDSSKSAVTICDAPCAVSGTPTATQLKCTTPAKTLAGSNQVCDVKVSVRNRDATLSNGYTYKTSLTPTITDVNPRRGGTGGSTRLTITGNGFGTNANAVTVTLAGTTCTKQTVTNTQVVCLTGSRKPSIKTKVALTIDTNGVATQDQADFEYIDVWSSPFSWGYKPPVDGDFVVIPSDMTILLDTDTPVIKMLLIDGGKLIFDEQDVELQAERILITNGGTLQIGTEEKQHQSKAIITLHGHPRSTELPIYGTKNIGVREGTLDFHGRDPGVVWTVLDRTVNAGESEITLREPVTWEIGDYIAIASTGHRHSQAQNEMRQISGKKNGNKTLELSSALTHRHLGETKDLGSGYKLEARAEVGLLTRNILIRGSNNSQWSDYVAPCPEGFDTGEFATQTCFQGRFGEEIGSDQYGAQIMFHATRPNENLVTGRIENIEMTYAGQAFRIGRYAIHFHLNGDMQGNYVKGCAIHHSFNRAVNIHGTNYINVENNVVYDIMGGAIFLEDGVEIGNIFQYNLAIFVKGSSSLQNDDITPAAYWLTNANNTVQHNHAAGGTHFGFWYRMHKHPDGPSFTPNYCPQHVPLGVFQNNTVHAHGWFGIWIFKEFYPMEGGGCDDNNPIAAKFYSLNAWNNEKGAEWVGVGAVQFIDFYMVNNEKAGIEMKLMSKSVPFSTTRGGMLENCTIVAGPVSKGNLEGKPTKKAIIPPYARGLLMKDITFVNFEGDKYVFGVTQVDGITKDQCGGFTYQTSGLKFVNSPNKIAWRWLHEAEFHDLDGTLTGIVGGKAVPTMGTLPPSKCTNNIPSMSVNASVPGSICNADVKFHRWAWNKAIPGSLKFKNVSFVTQYGDTIAQFRTKRVTHKEGWVALLVSGEQHQMEFVDAGHITNISYTGTIYDLATDDYVIMSHNLTQRPDRFGTRNGLVSNKGSKAMVSYAASNDGDWFFDQDSTVMSYIASGKQSRGKRALSPALAGTTDVQIKFKVFRCFYKDCKVPVDPNSLPPPANRPEDFMLWHDVATWETAEAGYGGNNGDGTFRLPKEGENVKINSGDWVVVREPLPPLGKLYINGVLEFEYLPVNGKIPDHVLSCTHILIGGGRLIIGWENNRYNGTARIILRGDHLTPDMPLPNGPNMGAKALGVFGGLDLHGIERDVMFTHLDQTASSGSNSLTLTESVDWVVGDEIVIATTAYSAWQTETMKITAISGNKKTLTLNATLQHTHLVTSVNTGNGKSVKLAAEVGLLTQNIKIIGGPYSNLQKQAFGARVLVGKFNQDGKDYIGYARLNSVEFYHAGQEGWTDDYDPRFSIAFLDIGPVTDAKPSYVNKCSFHHNFAPAIGVFNVINMTVTDNVIYHTVGASIQDGGINNVYRNNLVTLMRFPGTFNDREEERMEWEAGIDVHRATGVVLTGNTVAGTERAGFQVDGMPCDDSTEVWTGNVAHSALFGVETLPKDGLAECSKITGFTVYKAWDTGIYFQSKSNLVIDGVTVADSTLGIYPMVFGPGATSHSFKNKYINIKNSVIVGSSDDFDCNDDMSSSDRNIKFSGNSRSWRSPTGGKVGVAFGTFSSGSNNAPVKPFHNIMSYQAIGGLTTITDTTFVGFQSKCSGKQDVAITTMPSNDDAQHPIRLQRITKVNVGASNTIFYHRAQLGKINPADCVDMECDGMKKALIDDLDGSFIGSKGSYIAESEFAWGGDPRRGLGDYRIPKTLLTDQNGDRIDVKTIAPKRGIIRDDSCTYKPTLQAYECHDLDYEMVMLESMDDDTELRRLSPIALLGDGYLDLINGPQDHGWCFGYTCQKRLSTFPLIVATGKNYILHYSGTSPQKTRIRLLNSDDTQAFVVGIFYSLPQRLDVFVGDNYIEPTNAELNNEGQQVLKAPTRQGEYIPAVASDPTGSNYFDKADKTLHVLVRGPTAVDIRMSPLLIIGFSLPAMTVEDFFGANMVNNLAIFLDIPASKIKVAKAVPATSRRKKRSVNSFEVELEISNPPSNSSNSTQGGNSDDLSYDQLQNITSSVINGVQLGTLGGVLNVTILDFDVTEPVPAPSSSAWRNVAISSSSGESYKLKIQIPKKMEVETEPVGFSEGNPLAVHPVLYMTDSQNDFVKQLGSKVVPWKVTASLKVMRSSYDSWTTLTGDESTEFILGWANFTNLIITHSGYYKLDYRVTYPAEAASLFTAQSVEFYVRDRTLAGSIASQDTNTTINENFNIQAEIIDGDNNAKVPNITWKGHSWTCRASQYVPELSPGQLKGVTMGTVNDTSGIATFDELQVTAPGSYFVELEFKSTPADYSFKVVSAAVEAFPVGYSPPVIEVSKQVRIRFLLDYTSTLNNRAKFFQAAVKNKIQASIDSTNVSIGAVALSEGSILATFAVEGSTVKVEAALEDLYLVVGQKLFTFPFFGATITADGYMWVDSQVFIRALPNNRRLTSGELAAIIVCCVVFVIGLIVTVILVKKYHDKKHKTDTVAVPATQIGYHNLSHGLPADIAERGDLAPPKRNRPNYKVDSPRESSALSGPSSSDAPAPPSELLYRKDSQGLPEITLDSGEKTRPPPLPAFDEDSSDDDDDGNTPSGMGTNRSRPRSRPPSKPSQVWEASGKI